jgi:hypothetical protein
MEEFWR